VHHQAEPLLVEVDGEHRLSLPRQVAGDGAPEPAEPDDREVRHQPTIIRADG
jgi:hypothetical protein